MANREAATHPSAWPRQQMPDASNIEPISVSVDEGARLIGVSRAFLYQKVMAGECPSWKLGARRLLSVAALRKWVEDQAAKGDA